MKRPGYREAVRWIAANDEPTDLDAFNVAGYLTTVLVADLFGVDAERVAGDVVKLREADDLPRTRAYTLS
jgi:hypothetical protein